jgi:hypothetical protein
MTGWGEPNQPRVNNSRRNVLSLAAAAGEVQN